MKSVPGVFVAILMAVTAVSQAADLAIVDARLYPAPDAAPIDRGTVLVRDGRIVEVGASDALVVPEGIEVIDGRGLFVTAGFWNNHVHLLSTQLQDPAALPAAELQAALEQMLTRWGFTTVFDVASLESALLVMQQRIDAGEVAGPDILHVGAPFYPEDGTPVYARALLEELGAPSPEVSSVEQARTRARQQLEAGATGLKLFAGSIVGGEIGVLPMDVDIARAIVEEAHRVGKPVFAHPTNVPGLEVSMASGVDVLAHTTPFSGPWDEDMVRRLHAAGLALTPTLTLFEVELQRENAPDEVVARFIADSTQQLGAFADAGGTVLFGTDVGFIDHADTRREFELMAQAGLDWRRILASLTTAPAERFGYGDRRGRIAPGMEADLVILGTDPAVEVTGLGDVRATIRGGRLIYRPEGRENTLSEMAGDPAPEAPAHPDVHRFSIGRLDAVVLRDGDILIPNNGSMIAHGRPPAETEALLRAAGEPTDALRLSLQSLLVHSGNRVLLFDTGAGKAGSASVGRLPQSLQAAGIEPAQVTDIFISHGHHDHVGGLVDADGNPGFANATIRMSAPEWQALQADEAVASLAQAIADRVEAFEPGAEVLPGVTSVPVDGHTPGHSAYKIMDDGERLLYIGDSAHHHVVSVQRPRWTIAADRDAPLAEDSREALLARAADGSLTLHAPHFPFPGLGRIERRDGSFAWVPLD